MNIWLVEQCVSYARAHPHPEVRDRTIWEQFEAERPNLVPYALERVAELTANSKAEERASSTLAHREAEIERQGQRRGGMRM